jgi:cadmium resistance protein CadD (predicted permease)
MTSAFVQVFMVTALTFMSTNTDNLVIYTGFLSAKQGNKLSLVFAYFIAMSVLLTIIFCLSLFFSKIPEKDVKYLGMVLAAVGVFLLVRHFYRKGNVNESHSRFETLGIEVLLGVTMLMDSFDTMSVFVPLFADSSEAHDVAVGASFISCFIVWGLSGLYISRLRIFKFLTTHKDIITPIIMMLVGLYIFIDTPGDVE